MFRPREIQKLIRQRPFQPFRIVTSSGETYEVHHPELVMVGDRDLVVGTMSARDPSRYREVDLIALLHVAAVEVLPEQRPVAPDSEAEDS